ncbi:C39 family peptidase [candidate division KSB1 bacterium]|nr:C39 family peptidase [candidate division KSB1 bacterium]
MTQIAGNETRLIVKGQLMEKSILYRCIGILSYFWLQMAFVYLPAQAQIDAYPDQHFVLQGADSLLSGASEIENMTAAEDGAAIRLVDGETAGFVTFAVQTAPYPFVIGLPSWNGTAPADEGAFRVFIRVPYRSGWSPWLEVGYWKENAWAGTKSTRYAGGYIDIDTVVLYDFATQWQFKIEMKRNSADVASPTLSLLSFFTSDERTTENLDFASIIGDSPDPIFIPTQFLAQREVSSEYGGRICSPTIVSMILLSYGIAVDPLKFALDTYDPYYDLFGVWPRVVQNASEYGLQGTVTRYRTWSAARDVLTKGGRIGMSIGAPLYSGHLVMLAGFTENGDPIVHDPARPYDGYAHVFNKSDLSHAWFDKGGVGYTFYLRDTTSTTTVEFAGAGHIEQAHAIVLYPNYPNPFNTATTFYYELLQDGFVEFTIYNMRGQVVRTLESEVKAAGSYRFHWNGTDETGAAVSSGGYVYRIRFNGQQAKSGRLVILR